MVDGRKELGRFAYVLIALLFVATLNTGLIPVWITAHPYYIFIYFFSLFNVIMAFVNFAGIR